MSELPEHVTRTRAGWGYEEIWKVRKRGWSPAARKASGRAPHCAREPTTDGAGREMAPQE